MAQYYVNPATGNDGAAGTQAAPFKTITHALQRSTSGDRIQLAPGTYSAGETFPLTIPVGVVLVGNESTKGSGILITGSGRYLSPTFAGQNVTIQPLNRAEVRGVTVTNPEIRGTAIWVESTNPTIANNTFVNNKREGVFATGSASPAVLDNVATQNSANGFSIVRTAKGEWRRNVCQNTGFGFAIGDTAAPLLADNRLVENRSGVVANRDCRPVLRTNIFERNTSEGLVAAERAVPNIGTPQDPGGNIFRDNGMDIVNGTGVTIVSAGNQVDPTKIQGPVELVGNQIPQPTPSPTPTPTPSPTPTPTPPPGGLTDISGHWAEGFIKGLVGQGYISGFPDGTFQPDAPITRAQYAAVLAKAFDLPAKQPQTQFSDVPIGFWAYAAVTKANQMGFIAGFPDGSFRPNQNLTRIQAIVSLMSGLGFTGGVLDVLNVYSDRAQIPSYATEKVATATQRRIVVNYPNVRQLDPMRDISRAELVALVYQSLVALNRLPAIASPYIVTATPSSDPFTDIRGHWAEVFIKGLASQNLISGYADGSFKPDLPINRAQYAALISAAFNPVPQRALVTFTDVPADFWAKTAIDQAYRGKFLSGFPDGTFQPGQNILRLQVLLSLVSGLGLPSGDVSLLNAFDDRGTIPQYALDEVAIATQRHLVVNYPNLRQLNPNRDASRAEVAAMVYQALVQAGRAPAVTSPYIV